MRALRYFVFSDLLGGRGATRALTSQSGSEGFMFCVFCRFDVCWRWGRRWWCVVSSANKGSVRDGKFSSELIVD